MPSVAPVSDGDGADPGLAGPGVPVAVPRPVPASEAGVGAASGPGGTVLAAAPPCRVRRGLFGWYMAGLWAHKTVWEKTSGRRRYVI